MRILHIGKYYPPVPGGIERIVQLMAHGLASLGGHEVDVMVANKAPRHLTERENGVRVRRLATYGTLKGAPITPRMLLSGRLARRYDVVHIHSPNPLPELSFLLARPTNAVVANDWGQITHHATLLKAYLPFYSKYYANATAVAVPSANYGRTAPHLSRFANKMFVLPPGIRVEDWAETEEVSRQVEALQADSALETVLFVGRLVRWKGVDVLLEAASRLQVRVLVAGSGPERAALEAQAKSLGMAHRTRFLGAVTGPALVAAYRASDIFVLPSRSPNEAFGLVQVEAMACGLPVVNTELGTGTTEINRDGETGLVLPPDNAPRLRGAIKKLVDDPALRRRLGERAEARAREEFSEVKMYDRLMACYTWCADRNAGR